jgi:hypothetical protein
MCVAIAPALLIGLRCGVLVARSDRSLRRVLG